MTSREVTSVEMLQRAEGTLLSILIRAKGGTTDDTVTEAVTTAATGAIADLQNCINVYRGFTSAVAVASLPNALKDITSASVDLMLIVLQYNQLEDAGFVAAVVKILQSYSALPISFSK